MELELPWRLTGHSGGPEVKFLTPLSYIAQAIAWGPWVGDLWWRGGAMRPEWVGKEFVFEPINEVFEPIFIYGDEQDVVLFKLKYF